MFNMCKDYRREKHTFPHRRLNPEAAYFCRLRKAINMEKNGKLMIIEIPDVLHIDPVNQNEWMFKFKPR